jgi:vacuolar-type H+-ATPase subunit I/STV1
MSETIPSTHVSPLTTFLAKLIGLLTLIFSLALVLRGEDFVAIMTSFMRDRAILILFGMIALGSGLAMVLAHNRWSGGILTVVVTVLGWIFLIRGLLILFLPSDTLEAFIAALRFEERFYLYALVPFLLGAYLTYAGFTAEKR